MVSGSFRIATISALSLRDRRLRNAGRAGEAEPRRHRVAGHARLGEGRHVRQHEEPRRPGDAERAQASVLHHLGDHGHVVHERVDALAEQIGRGLRRAAIRHMLHLDPGGRGEQLKRQMLAGAVARRGAQELARVRLRHGMNSARFFAG